MTKIKLTLVLFVFFVLTTVFTGISFGAKNNSKIILSPSFQQMGIGEEFTVDVLISSDTPSVGADVKINYDARVIEVVSIDIGEAYDLLPVKSAKDGIIILTGLMERESGLFFGIERIATLNLKTIDAGDTSLNVQFNEGDTTDSNITSIEVKDTLGGVDQGVFVVGSPFERSLGAAKRFAFKSLPVFIFLLVLGISAYVGYRWWRKKQTQPKNVFIPREVPLDKPPDP